MIKKESIVARLASAEDQFDEIERLTKQLRKRLDAVAETVRSAVVDLSRAARKR